MTNSKRIPCPNCTQTFITEDAKEKHYKAEHAPIKCAVCNDDRIFISLESLEQHTKVKHSTKAKIKKIPQQRKQKQVSIKKTPQANINLSNKEIMKIAYKYYKQKNYKQAKKFFELVPQDIKVRSILKKINKMKYELKGHRDAGYNYLLDGKKKERKSKHPSEKKEDKESHTHILWWLGRPSNQDELNIISGFLLKNGAKLVREDSVYKHFRVFNEDSTSLHIEVELVNVGFRIFIHVDLEAHKKVIHNTQSRDSLIQIYGFLKNKFGRVFYLPRDIKEVKRLKY